MTRIKRNTSEDVEDLDFVTSNPSMKLSELARKMGNMRGMNECTYKDLATHNIVALTTTRSADVSPYTLRMDATDIVYRTDVSFQDKSFTGYGSYCVVNMVATDQMVNFFKFKEKCNQPHTERSKFTIPGYPLSHVSLYDNNMVKFNGKNHLADILYRIIGAYFLAAGGKQHKCTYGVPSTIRSCAMFNSDHDPMNIVVLIASIIGAWEGASVIYREPRVCDIPEETWKVFFPEFPIIRRLSILDIVQKTGDMDDRLIADREPWSYIGSSAIEGITKAYRFIDQRGT